MTREMKKLIDHKNAAQLAINVLCDLSKKYCAMCKWKHGRVLFYLIPTLLTNLLKNANPG
jgi:hypothetical protein